MDRKKIFGIFAGFLAVMLVFTILSRAVSGAAMARIKTVKISTGTIDHRFRHYNPPRWFSRIRGIL